MKQILCFGDSNTYGLIPGTTGRYSWNIRWTGRLEKMLKDEGVRIVEEGLCGRTTVFEDELRAGRRGTDLLPVLLEAHSPLSGVVLMLGTNDCKTVYGASAEVIGKGIEKLIRQIREQDPEIEILLISPVWLGEDVWKTEFDTEFNPESVQTSRRLAGVYGDIAHRHNCRFLAASDHVTVSGQDQEHLDEKGHEVLANVIYGTVKEMTNHGL